MGQDACAGEQAASRLCLLPAPWHQGHINIWIFSFINWAPARNCIRLNWCIWGSLDLLCFISFTLFFPNLLISFKMKICVLFFNFSSSSSPFPSPLLHRLFFFFFLAEIVVWFVTNLFSILQVAFLMNWLSKSIAQLLPSGNNSFPGFPERMLPHTHSLEKSKNDTILQMLRGWQVLKATAVKILYSMEIDNRNNFLKSLWKTYRLHICANN